MTLRMDKIKRVHELPRESTRAMEVH
jgi:hypothetical protein